MKVKRGRISGNESSKCWTHMKHDRGPCVMSEKETLREDVSSYVSRPIQ